METTVPKLGWSFAEMEVATGLSRATLYRLLASGDLATVKIRGRRLIPAWQAQKLLGAQENDRQRSVMAGNVANLIPFRPGQSGNPGGKPAGARNRLQADFLNDLANHDAAHGKDAIERMFKKNPIAYIRTVASLMPKQFENCARAVYGRARKNSATKLLPLSAEPTRPSKTAVS